MKSTYDGLNEQLQKLLRDGINPTFEYTFDPRKTYDAENAIHRLAHCMANRCEDLTEGVSSFCPQHKPKRNNK